MGDLLSGSVLDSDGDTYRPREIFAATKVLGKFSSGTGSKITDIFETVYTGDAQLRAKIWNTEITSILLNQVTFVHSPDDR